MQKGLDEGYLSTANSKDFLVSNDPVIGGYSPSSMGPIESSLIGISSKSREELIKEVS